MKKGRFIILALILLSFVMTAVFLMLMPDQVPVHYNAAGVVDRIGSKYESFIWPAVTALMGGFFLLMAKFQKGGSSGEKVLHVSGICVLLLFNALGAYFMYRSIVYDPETYTDITPDITKISAIGVGVILVILGNLMPKLRRNNLSGLRTKWSMASDTVWQKSQRFSGICAVACGFLTIIAAAILSGTASLAVCMVLIAVWVIVSVIASYRYYKKEASS